jgi:hypothetical protein
MFVFTLFSESFRPTYIYILLLLHWPSLSMSGMVLHVAACASRHFINKQLTCNVLIQEAHCQWKQVNFI